MYVGQLKGEKTADCMLATNGRPPMMCGFQSGMSGRCARVNCRNGKKTSVASASS
jgi:hypothetical protein